MPDVLRLALGFVALVMLVIVIALCNIAGEYDERECEDYLRAREE